MAGELVFITGVTGYVGFAVLLEALKTGYHIRASVRRAEQADEIKKHPDIKPFVEKLDLVIVPDITVDGAFDTALQGATYIEHIASPLPNPTENPEQDIVIPAIKGTTNILNSALKIPTLRRVVIASSAAAVVPMWAISNGDAENTYIPNSRIHPLPLPSGPWDSFVAAYQGAKSLALNATDRFIAEQKPHFTIVNVMSGFVIGPNKLVKEAAQVATGSNLPVMAIILGQTLPSAHPDAIADLRDIARIHVGALNESKVHGNKDFLVNAPKMSFDDVDVIARKHFPDAVADGRLPLGGKLNEVHLQMDGSETVRIFGELRTFEDAVKNLLEQYLELLGNA